MTEEAATVFWLTNEPLSPAGLPRTRSQACKSLNEAVVYVIEELDEIRWPNAWIVTASGFKIEWPMIKKVSDEIKGAKP